MANSPMAYLHDKFMVACEDARKHSILEDKFARIVAVRFREMCGITAAAVSIMKSCTMGPKEIQARMEWDNILCLCYVAAGHELEADHVLCVPSLLMAICSSSYLQTRRQSSDGI